MNLDIVGASAIGLAFLSTGDGGGLESASLAGAPEAHVGARLYASDAPVARYGEPVLPGDLALEDLGTVAAVVMGADGTVQALVVAVGGLWGIGARMVDVDMDRVHVVEADGVTRLVVDLSA